MNIILSHPFFKDNLVSKRNQAVIEGEDTNSQSGNDVDLSSDGSMIIIGAFANDEEAINSGQVRVYHSIIHPTQVGCIKAKSDGEYSRSAVAMSYYGNIIVVGAPYHIINGKHSGRIGVYREDSGEIPILNVPSLEPLSVPSFKPSSVSSLETSSVPSLEPSSAPTESVPSFEPSSLQSLEPSSKEKVPYSQSLELNICVYAPEDEDDIQIRDIKDLN